MKCLEISNLPGPAAGTGASSRSLLRAVLASLKGFKGLLHSQAGVEESDGEGKSERREKKAGETRGGLL